MTRTLLASALATSLAGAAAPVVADGNLTVYSGDFDAVSQSEGQPGGPGFAIGTWVGVLAPAASPTAVTTRLADAMRKILQSPEFGKRMAEIGAEPIGNTPEQMAQQIKNETEKFARLVKDAKVTIE